MQLSSTIQQQVQPPKHNIQALILHYYPNRYVLEPKISQFKNILIIHRENGQHKLQSTKSIIKSADRTRPFSCYIGMMQIFNSHFLMLVDKAKLVCNIQGHDIFQVVKISFVPLKEERQLSKDHRWLQISHLLSSVRTLLSCGFYFCFTLDLSLNRQAFSSGQQTDMSFCWNSYLSRHLVQPNRQWFTPLIQGFIRQTQCYINGKKIIYTLISRRSWMQGGTRFNSRGIDDQGYVANFVQTQQIVIYGNKLCSHVQVRGSVPCYWRQSGHIQIQIDLTRRQQPTRQAFLKHMKRLQQKYQLILCINLLCKTKPQQQLLTNIFEGLIKQSQTRKYIRYQYFDFHQVCKGMHYRRVNKFVNKLSSLQNQFGFYIESTDQYIIQHLQIGVLRTNCLDCLDRTNFTQTKIAAFVLESILNKLIGATSCSQRLLQVLDDPDQKDSLTISFRQMWADNGNILSYHYTGAQSTHAQIIRTGQAGLWSVLHKGKASLTRFYKQNFEDGDKQDAIHLMIGTHLDTVNLNQLQQWNKLNIVDI